MRKANEIIFILLWSFILMELIAGVSAQITGGEDGHLGCYVFQTSIFSSTGTSITNMDPPKCIEECASRGHKYASLYQLSICHCEDETPPTHLLATDRECSYKCIGSSSSTCGGSAHMNIYETGIKREDGYLGCYITSTSEILLGSSTTIENMSDLHCIDYCFSHGYTYAGLYSRSICRCGDEDPQPNLKSDGNDCSYKCIGDMRHFCGGPSHMNIYETGVPRCTFHGKTYGHNERLPGCFKVYCIEGNWLQRGNIDPSDTCSKCKAELDPHMETFDNWHYAHAEIDGIYSLAQVGRSRSPEFGVFNHLTSCGRNNTCVGLSTFRDSPETTIVLGDGKNIFKLLVNGVEYVIRDDIPRLVKVNNIEYPVLAWKYGSCVRLLGSSKISVQQCQYSVNIWAPNEFHNSLYGLCGYFDGDNSNDFTDRSGRQNQLGHKPHQIRFTTSWIVNSHRSKRMINDRAEGDNCSLDSTAEAALWAKCNKAIGAAGDGMTRKEQEFMLGDCVFDLCSISKNAPGNTEAIDNWLGAVTSVAEMNNDIAKKTTDKDIFPEPL